MKNPLKRIDAIERRLSSVEKAIDAAMASKPAAEKAKPRLFCSFCGKDQDAVHKLVAGPNVFICNECVLLCLDVLIRPSTPQERESA